MVVSSSAACTAATAAESKTDGSPALGVYVPPDLSYSAIGLAGARVGGGRHVEVCGDGQLLDYRPGTGWVIPRLLELEKHQPSVLVIDDKALALPPPDLELARDLIARTRVSRVLQA